MAQDSLFVKLQNVDKRIIYTLLFLILIYPMFNPIGLPLPITREVQSSFDFIENLPSGSIIMFASANAPGTMAELEPQSVAVISHMLDKGHRIVFNPYAPETARFIDAYMEICIARGYQEGVNVMRLPFLAGAETLYAAMGQDIKSVYDMVPSSPLWDSIRSVRDFAVWIDITGGEGQRWAMAHIGDVHNVPIVSLITAVILAVVQPYYTSGQFVGIVSGLSGAAEYEVLARAPGKGAAGMDAQSLGHLLIIGFIALGNIAFFASRRPSRSSGPGGDN